MLGFFAFPGKRLSLSLVSQGERRLPVGFLALGAGIFRLTPTVGITNFLELGE